MTISASDNKMDFFLKTPIYIIIFLNICASVVIRKV